MARHHGIASLANSRNGRNVLASSLALTSSLHRHFAERSSVMEGAQAERIASALSARQSAVFPIYRKTQGLGFRSVEGSGVVFF
jgi:hypothetical protein